MFALLRTLALLGVSVIAGIFISLGFVPGAAHAPDTMPPAVVTKQQPTQETNTVPSKNESPIASPPPSSPGGSSANTGTSSSGIYPGITNFDQSLQDALDALNKIKQQEQSATTTVDLNGEVRDAVVNILCTTAGSGPLNPISASGVFVSPRGIILTNAHVGQYFLLKNYPTKNFITCVARTGSPARSAYALDLLFISPSWIAKNANKIIQENPTGNGEHDYALLQVVGPVSNSVTLPTSFPYLPLSLSAPDLNTQVLLAGYPAGFLGGETVQKDLYAVSAQSTVGQLYTFGTNTVDIFSIGGTIVAQKGSSGGAVAVPNTNSPTGNALVGLIVTASDATDTASRDLRALSTEYIIRDFATESGTSLSGYLNGDLSQERAVFNQTVAPTLTASLVKVLEQ